MLQVSATPGCFHALAVIPFRFAVEENPNALLGPGDNVDDTDGGGGGGKEDDDDDEEEED